MHIRKYKPSDRTQIEHIHFETGFLGKSMTPFLSNNNIWKKEIKYYLEKEPESIFVLEDKNKITGYLLGCVNDNKNNEILSFILHNLERLFKISFLPKKDRNYWSSQFNSLVKIILKKSEEYRFKTPKNSGHFHINLLPEARGKKYGTKLLKEFEKYAKQNHVKLLHADGYQTKLNPNNNFWIKNNFKMYSKVKTSMWEKQLPNENINLICYSKKLSP
jgi:GNAT superfamily N-acetyltransferase